MLCADRTLWREFSVAGAECCCRGRQHSMEHHPAGIGEKSNLKARMVMPDDTQLFDRGLWRRRLERAHATGEPALFLLERAADDLVDRLSLVKREFPVAVVLGALGGLLTRRLQSQLPAAISCEASTALLADCPAPKLVGDEEWLPFRSESLDLLVSALVLQHVNDLPGALRQIRVALKPDGLFLASMVGGRTLHELRQAFVQAESEITGGVSPRVLPFADLEDAGTLLRRAGFALPVVDIDTVSVTYSSPLRLLADLRAMGGTNILQARRRQFLGKAVLMRAMAIYQEQFGRPDGRVSATFEIITMTGWAPHASQQQPLRPGSARMRLDEVLNPRSGDGMD